MRGIFAALAVLVAGTSVLLLASPFTGNVSGRIAAVRNGSLIFDDESTPNGYPQIWVVAPTGGGMRRLTHDQVFDQQPSWSPDGRRIAFTRGDVLNPDIYVMRADGSRRRRLTRGADASFPAWSPNGREIAFDGPHNQIYTVEVPGRHRPKLLRRYAQGPAWSPDGRKLAFQEGGICVMGAHGRWLARLTANDADVSPAWSPDGKSIAFLRVRAKGSSDIYVMNEDGRRPHAITKGAPVTGFNLAWAPNGMQLAFISGGFTSGFDLYVMATTGGQTRRVTGDGHLYGDVSWQSIR